MIWGISSFTDFILVSLISFLKTPMSWTVACSASEKTDMIAPSGLDLG